MTPQTLYVVAAEAAFILGCPDVGRAIRPLLEPFADQSSFNGLWIAPPIAYGAALAGAAAGQHGVDALFEQAIVVCGRLQAPMLRARTVSSMDFAVA